MAIEEKDVKVKMAICPECGNAIRVAIEHKMDAESKKEFMKEVIKYNLDVKTVSLEQYRDSGILRYCEEECSRK